MPSALGHPETQQRQGDSLPIVSTSPVNMLGLTEKIVVQTMYDSTICSAEVKLQAWHKLEKFVWLDGLSFFMSLL